jgi:hypothetical protein
VDEYLSYFNYGGSSYPIGLQFSTAPAKEEDILPTFVAYVQQAYASCGPIFACLMARASLFSEARFQWREFRQGRPGPLFGDTSLAPLETPWPNGTTGDLIVRLEQDYSLAGNFYGWRVGSGIRRLRPDWVTIVAGSRMIAADPSLAPDVEPIGYIFHPGGRYSGHDPILFSAEEICHFTGPTPDPIANFRGMSWLTPILRDVQADKQGTSHKINFLEQGGARMVVSIDIPDPDEFLKFVGDWREKTTGSARSYQTLFFNSGAAPNVATIGADLVQADFKAVHGQGESRIASVAGVPPIIVGFSEGLEAATYSNYELAMRRFADLTARPMWRFMAACFESVLEKPQTSSQLWYDDRDIPALKDDIAKRAETFAKDSAGMKLLIDAGYKPDAVTDCVNSGYDYNRLVHTGLPTVQVQQQAPSGNGQAEIAQRSVLEEMETLIEEAK